MKKKFLTLLLTAVCCLMGTQAWAATQINSLTDLQNAFTSGGDYQLNAEITDCNTTLTVASGKSVTLDLNNHTITGAMSAANTLMFSINGSLTIKDDSDDKGGKITCTTGGLFYPTNSDASANCKLTIINGTFESANWVVYSGYNNTVDLKGGVFKRTTSGNAIYTRYGTANVNITDGYYKGAVNKYSGTINISGGYYTEEPVGAILTGGKKYGTCEDPTGAGIYTHCLVDLPETEAAAKVNGVLYADFLSAMAVASADPASYTIDLLKDASYTANIDKPYRFTSTTDPQATLTLSQNKSVSAGTYDCHIAGDIYIYAGKFKYDPTLKNTTTYSKVKIGDYYYVAMAVNISNGYIVDGSYYDDIVSEAIPSDYSVLSSTTSSKYYVAPKANLKNGLIYKGFYSHADVQYFLADGYSSSTSTVMASGSTVQRRAIGKNIMVNSTDHKITAGEFEMDPSAYVADNSSISVNNNVWTVTAATGSEVAQIGNVKYPTFGDAFKNAKEGETITLLKTCTYDQQIWPDYDVTIDLNGFDLNLTYAPATNSAPIRLSKAKLTLTGNGTIKGNNHFALVWMTGSMTDASNFTVLNVGSGVTLENDAENSYVIGAEPANDLKATYGVVMNIEGTIKGYYGIYLSGNARATNGNVPEINLTNASIQATKTGMYLAGYGKTTYTNSNINITDKTDGGNCVDIAAGTFHMVSGTMNGATNTGITPSAGGSITTENGCGIYVKQHSTTLPVTVIIDGGQISAGVALCEQTNEAASDPEPDKINITINGGSFNSDATRTQGTSASVYKQSDGAHITIYAGEFSQAPSLDYIAPSSQFSTPGIIDNPESSRVQENCICKVGMVADYTLPVYYYGYETTPESKTFTNVADWETFLKSHPNAVALVDYNNTMESFAQATKNVILNIGDGYTPVCPNLVLTDLSNVQYGSIADLVQMIGFYAPCDFIAYKGNYKRTLGDGYNTVCVPFAFSQPEGTRMLGYNSLTDDKTAVSFRDITEASAGVGAIIKATGSTAWTVDFDNEGQGTTISHEPASGAFCGVFAPDASRQSCSTGTYYALKSTGAFGPLSGYAHAFRACFYAANGEIKAAPRLVILGAEEVQTVTGLDEQNAVVENGKFFQNGRLYIRHNGVVYDAAGQLVK